MLIVKHLHAGILDNINLQVETGQCIAICGASGSGKTTLLNTIVGSMAYQGGIFIQRQCVNHLPVWQRACRHLNQQLYLFPHLSIDHNLRLAQYAAGLPQNKPQRLSLLEQLEIGHLASRYPAQISGGEQQRAALARALISQCKLLLLDEPFSHLDWPMRKRLWQLLNKLRTELSLSVLLVTHEPEEAEALADSCLTIHKGQLL